ncbi:MAG: tyrosine-type recombinase/integrase [Clostridioides sp.]|jgi:integrase/recombinase XerD|nr:tyrosine-type recombinase/integrase [Clostridioides sp.]
MNVIEDYIGYIRNKRRLSENTVMSYSADIKKYTDYLNREKVDILEVSENDIFGFLIELEKDKASVSSICRMISSIRSFHDYMYHMKIAEKNPAMNMKKPKVKREEYEILTEEEITSLLHFEDIDTPKAIRDKAIFEVLYGTGIKVSELADLDLEDVNLELDYIQLNKNKRNRVIPLLDTTKVYLEKYIDESRMHLADEGENALFVSALGHRFTRQGIWKIIKKYSSLKNIKKNINPTMLRRSFAIHLLQRGANIGVVSKILGNTNLSSIQGYLDQIEQNISKELKDKHPRNEVD